MSEIPLDASTCIINCHWLNTNLNQPNLVILDASISSVNSTKTSELDGLRIPNARFFDLKNIFSNQESDLPAMMPSAESFAESARALGINQNSQIVVYDNLGIYSSARAWWMFRAMEHENVAVLDGGLPEWDKLGYPTESILPTKFVRGDFEAHFNKSMVSTLPEVKDAVNNDQIKVIDARNKGRFNGTAPEPREGLRSGSITNSINLPFGEVLKDGCMRPKDELRAIVKELGITDQQLIFSCGSGVTACIILLAAEIAGFDNYSVYDGSWAEWGLLNQC